MNYINMSHVNITMTQTHFSMFFLLLSTVFVRGGVHSTMLNAVNPGLRPQTAGTQICCFNYQISKTNNKSALDRDTSGKLTCWGGGLQEVIVILWIWKMVGKVHMYCITGRPCNHFDSIGYCYTSAWMEEKSGISSGCFAIERFICCCHWNKVCLFNARLNPSARQRYALFFAGHPSVSAQLLRFWLYFMSPNCDWPGLPVASFHPREEGVRSFLISGAFLMISMAVYLPPPSWDGEGHVSSSSSPWVVWLSGYLHLSTGAGSSLHPSPSSFSVRVLNIPHSAPFTAFKQNRFIVYQQ